MEAFLKSNPDIDVLFAHNDDMGLGAIEAIEAAGKVPGKDIKIITVDAVKDGMQALADGKINFIVECSPLLGPQLMDLAKKVVAGETVPSASSPRRPPSRRSRPRPRCPTASTEACDALIRGAPPTRRAAPRRTTIPATLRVWWRGSSTSHPDSKGQAMTDSSSTRAPPRAQTPGATPWSP